MLASELSFMYIYADFLNNYSDNLLIIMKTIKYTYHIKQSSSRIEKDGSCRATRVTRSAVSTSLVSVRPAGAAPNQATGTL